MRKHRLNKFLSSIYESDGVVEEKEDITTKLEKILELIDRDDDKGELVSLVENFHESYQSLHGRYGHLMEKLKASSVHNKKVDDNDGSGINSSSESDDDEYKSLNKQVDVWKLKNKDLEDKVALMNSELNAAEHLNSLGSKKLSEAENKVGVFKVETENLKAEMGKLRDQNAGLKQELEKTCHLMKNQVDKKSLENADLVSEIQTLNLKLGESVKRVSDLGMQLNNLNEEKGGLHMAIQTLNLKLEASVKQVSDLGMQLNNLNEEKSGMHMEIQTLNLKLEASVKQVSDLGMQLNNLNEEKDGLHMEIQTLNLKLEESVNQVSDLGMQLNNLNEEKDGLHMEIQTLNLKLGESVKQVSDLGMQLNNLNEEKGGLHMAIQTLNLKLEASVKQVSDLGTQLNNLNEEKDGLHMENVKILSRVQELKNESDEKLSEINGLKSNLVELKSGYKLSEEKNSELIENLKIKDDEKELFSKEYETLKSEKEAADHKVIKFGKTLQLLDSEKLALVNVLDCITRDNSELVRRWEVEKTEISGKVFELEVKFDELTTDYGILEDQFKQSCTNLDFARSKTVELETSLALANQRHKVESETNVGRIKELLRERRGLEDILTVEFSRLDDVFRHTELEFEKTREHLQSQLVQCREELREVKEALVSKKHELMARTEHSRDEIRGLQVKLAGKTVEEEELKRKLVDMEGMFKEKEEEGNCKDEDKREAIRQLCFQIEYHRMNCDHLFQVLSKKVKRNRG